MCFGGNDVRCVYGTELDKEIVYRTARAIVEFLKCKEILVGRDMRLSSNDIRASFIKGIVDSGATAIDLGLVDTPTLYFASGFLKLPGAIITASHNPGEYNGIKIVKKDAIVVGERNGLNKVKKLVEKNKFKKSERKGKVVKKDIFKDYRKHVHSFIGNRKLKGKVVVDAGNGMAGKIVPIIYKGMGLKVIQRHFKLDGTFPMHLANPAIYKNLRDLQAAVRNLGADYGMAFDADMDRVFFINEKGEIVISSLTASMILKNRFRKPKVVYSTTMSKIVLETIKKIGGKGFKEKVGHFYIKSRMRKENADFGCEHSGHFYYKKNYFADSGIITSLIVADIFTKSGKKFSELIKEFEKYHKIEEHSVKLKNKDGILEKIEKKYKSRAKKIEKKDGLTMEFKDFWFNVRKSGTEKLIRINLESKDREIRNTEFEKLLRLIKS